MKVDSAIQIKTVSADVRSFLKTLSGTNVSMFIKKIDTSLGRAQVQLAGRVFEAVLAGPDIKAGQVLNVLVQTTKHGQIQLIVGKDGFSRPAFANVLPGLLSRELSEWISFFFFAEKESISQKTRQKNKNTGKKWTTEFRKNLNKSDLFSKNLDQLLEFLTESSAEVDFDSQNAYQESFLVKTASDQKELEKWQFHCFGNSTQKPYYYFFYLKTGPMGSICGNILAPDPLFCEITIMLKFESPVMHKYFNENKYILLNQLNDLGIKAQELILLKAESPGRLDLRV